MIYIWDVVPGDAVGEGKALVGYIYACILCVYSTFIFQSFFPWNISSKVLSFVNLCWTVLSVCSRGPWVRVALIGDKAGMRKAVWKERPPQPQVELNLRCNEQEELFCDHNARKHCLAVKMSGQQWRRKLKQVPTSCGNIPLPLQEGRTGCGPLSAAAAAAAGQLKQNVRSTKTTNHCSTWGQNTNTAERNWESRTQPEDTCCFLLGTQKFPLLPHRISSCENTSTFFGTFRLTGTPAGSDYISQLSLLSPWQHRALLSNFKSNRKAVNMGTNDHQTSYKREPWVRFLLSNDPIEKIDKLLSTKKFLWVHLQLRQASKSNK